MKKITYSMTAISATLVVLLGTSIYLQNSMEWPFAFLLFVSLLSLCVLENRNGQRLRVFAYKDGPTGLLNRSAYEERVKAFNKRVQKKNASKFGVVMFDVNGLKAVNDALGHRIGDEYIAEAARLIKEVYKNADIYRFGGDEFVAIIKGSDADRIEELEKSFFQKIADFNAVSGDYFMSGLSIAVGSATYNKNTDAVFADIFARADKLMYENKRIQKSKS